MPRKLMARGRADSSLLVGGLAAIIATAATLGLPASSAQPAPTYSETLTNCRVVDGDTLRCDGGRVRLLGIDAPELPGHCAPNRECAPGDPFESTESLRQGLGDGSSVRIERIGADRYGRTLAMVMGRRGDLSCWQLARGEAIYKPRWDNGGRVAKACRL